MKSQAMRPKIDPYHADKKVAGQQWGKTLPPVFGHYPIPMGWKELYTP